MSILHTCHVAWNAKRAPAFSPARMSRICCLAEVKMTENLWCVSECDEAEGVDLDLQAFAERHDLAVGEARQIILEAGCDRAKAEALAHRMKKW
jgi:hypothetical protein